MKKILTTLLSIVLALSLTNCDSYLDVNNNPNAPDHVDSYLKLAPIIQYIQGKYYDLTYALASLTQMWGSSSNTSYANNYYPSSSDTGGQYWRVAYFDHGVNLEELINQCLEKKEYAFAGLGLIIKAFDWDLMVKYHGELPYFDKYTLEQKVFPYDMQKDIYPDIRALAYQGIKYIEMEEGNTSKYGTLVSANDYIYHGNFTKWKKFAYAILARNYISLSQKTDFVSSGFADSVIYCVQHAFASTAEDAVVEVAPKGATKGGHPNFWGPYRQNLVSSYFQHEFAVQTLSGTVPLRDETTGEKIRNDNGYVQQRIWYPYHINPKQTICDTVRSVPGHCDPRITLLLGFEEKKYADYTEKDTILMIKARPNPGVGDGFLYDTTKMEYQKAFPTEADYVKNYMSKRYVGGFFTYYDGSAITVRPSYKLYWETGNAYTHYPANFYGTRITTAANAYAATVGFGRWLYRDDAPYILATYAELKFCAAEAYWKKGDKASALQAFKDGVAAHMDFCHKYIYAPTAGELGGDKITAITFRALANEYLAGPFVNGLTVNDLTLSHIMQQKWVALYPWGAHEAWVDMRKYHYDIDYTGDYPKTGNGWTIDRINQKWDSNPDKVYKGLFLLPSKAYGNLSYNLNNQGSPCYRIRPRYNSEYMWNVPSLEKITPIPGTAPNYQCSIPWFAFPGDVPPNL